MRRARFLLDLVIVGCTAMLAAPSAQTPDTTVYTVSYVEVAPASDRAAIALLKQYREASRAEDGHVSIDLLAQIDRPGHFVLVEAWKSQQAYDDHEAAASAKTLVEKLLPLKISPVDQRPYKVV